MNKNKKLKKLFVIDEITFSKLTEIHESSYDSFSDLVVEAINLLYDHKIGAKGILK